jgi:hypothetical protein
MDSGLATPKIGVSRLLAHMMRISGKPEIRGAPE